MKPATSLPWVDLMPATGSLSAKVREPNAAFALHACNAYPRLVANLRKDKSMEAQDLLRELGELE